MGSLEVKIQRKRLLAEVQGLLVASGQTEPVFNPERLFPYLKVVRVEHAEMETPSLLIPTKGGFIVKINNRYPRIRQRVLCAHELAHTFFYDSNTTPPVKLNYGLTKTWHEEGLCN